MKKNPKMVVVGRIGRVYGVKGWLKLQSFTEPPENILDFGQWFILQAGNWQPAEIEAIKIHGNALVLKLTACETPEQAQVYTNAEIGVTRDQLPKLATDEYYWSDLEGLTVINQQGVKLGVVDHILATGANDVLVVKGTKERLLPYIDQVVLEVDLAKGILRVDWEADF